MGIELALVSAGLQVFSGLQQYRQAEANAKYYRQVAENQRAARDVSRFQEERRNKAIRSAQLAQIGASGVELTGSPLGYVKRTVEEQEIDILLADYNAEVAATDTESRAAFQEQQGQSALLGSIGGAAQTVYGGYQRYDMLNKSGSSVPIPKRKPLR